VAQLAALGFDVDLRPSNLAELTAALTAGTPPIVFLDTGPLDYWSIAFAHVAVLVGLDLTSVSLNGPFFDPAPQRTSLTSFHQAWAANNFLAAFIRPRP
jgi:hypothetical protein